MQNFQICFDDEQAMQQWLQVNASAFGRGLVCYLYGDLGAGKTSFCRSLLQSLGHQGAVKSPTYTLLEIYEIQELTVCHFDLYRLGEPEELSYLGADDYANSDSLWLVEWPARGQGFLPVADLEIHIDILASARRFSFVPKNDNAAELCRSLQI